VAVQDWKVKNGVGASTLVLPQPQNNTKPPADLLSFLEQTMQYLPRLEWEKRFAQRLVCDSQGQALSIDSAYKVGQRVYYWRDAGDEPRVPFEEQVIYQDEHIVVADKPHFLPVAPTGRYVQESLLVRLKKRLNLAELAPIHRIDRDTAGLVLFSVNAAERGAYMQLFRERTVRKVYECLAPHLEHLPATLKRRSRMVPSPSHFMQMCEEPGEPNSETLIERLQVLGALAHYRLTPLTGKRHQLRVHMNALGAPICNDGIYPVLTPEPPLEDLAYDKPLALLAKSLAFNDPITQQVRCFESRQILPR
jgi:tRNA pseudouridine32 synthase / 23S rRNA pseudouridine746 synthase